MSYAGVFGRCSLIAMTLERAGTFFRRGGKGDVVTKGGKIIEGTFLEFQSSVNWTGEPGFISMLTDDDIVIVYANEFAGIIPK